MLQPDNLSGLLTIPLAIILVRSKSGKVHAVLASAILAILVLDTVLSNYLIAM